MTKGSLPAKAGRKNKAKAIAEVRPQELPTHKDRARLRRVAKTASARADLALPAFRARRKAKAKANAKANAEIEAPSLPDNYDRRVGEALGRMTFGGDPPPPTKFDVPLVNGGPIALLMVANLDDERDVRTLQGTMHSHGTPATVEQLKRAQEFGRVLSVAMVQGHASGLWRRMKKALHTLRGDEMARRAVVQILGDLLHFKRSPAPPGYVDPPTEGLTFRIGRAHEALMAVNPAFKGSRDDLCTLIGGQNSAKNIGALGIAVKLSMSCGAFGDRREEHETDEEARKRVKRNYEKAGAKDHAAGFMLSIQRDRLIGTLQWRSASLDRRNRTLPS